MKINGVVFIKNSSDNDYHLRRWTPMKLDRVKRGCCCRILSLPSDQIKEQCIRFGIGEGETVKCCEVVPSGPIVVCKNRQEIAIGRALAQKIEVEPVFRCCRF